MKYGEVADTFMMDRQQFLFYFTKMDELLREKGQELKIYVSGGANMCLFVQSRDKSHDIDAVPSDEDLLREISEKMAKLFSLPKSWINPSATIFVTGKMLDEAVLGLNYPNLKVYFLAFRAMLVLKVLSSRRKEDGFPDMEDSVALIKKLGITAIKEIDDLINEYKPDWNNAFVLEFAKEALSKANEIACFT